MRELRNHGGEVLDRVARGESVIVTRDGAEVAELRPRTRPAPAPAELIARWKVLPVVDTDALRRDVDGLVDPSL